jgi:putative AdoMet-dependent methyltransferase
MSPERKPDIFDSWAPHYDDFVDSGSTSFPFAGYREVLERIFELADSKSGMKILDVGVGTGLLAQKFIASGCETWGIDYSSKMLEEARKKLPDAHLVLGDVRSPWPSDLSTNFDRIVSAYVLHHFDLDTKIEVIRRMAYELLGHKGRLVIGDISFSTFAQRAKKRREFSHLWDDDEYYWAADEMKTRLLDDGFNIVYEQVSFCAGVYVILPIQSHSL